MQRSVLLKFLQRPKKNQKQEPEGLKGNKRGCDTKLQEKEIEEAIRNIWKRKSTGPDGITNKMIQITGQRNKKILQKLSTATGRPDQSLDAGEKLT